MNIEPIQTLLADWHSEAATLRRRGATAQAEALESCFADLAVCIESAQSQALTLTQAAAVSGFSADHLGRLVRQGKLPNAGREGAPRIRLGDLPRKPDRDRVDVAEQPPLHQVDNAQIVQSIIEHGGG